MQLNNSASCCCGFRMSWPIDKLGGLAIMWAWDRVCMCAFVCMYIMKDCAYLCLFECVYVVLCLRVCILQCKCPCGVCCIVCVLRAVRSHNHSPCAEAPDAANTNGVTRTCRPNTLVPTSSSKRHANRDPEQMPSHCRVWVRRICAAEWSSSERTKWRSTTL